MPCRDEGWRPDWARLLQELAAAPSRAEAERAFRNSDWLFLRMTNAERERAYVTVENIVAEKPK
jgi:hypothetical protein